MTVSRSVLDAIGNTPLVQLSRVVPRGCARIVVKLEGQNPTGSMKDRMAQAMIAGAERDGRLNAGDAIVEYTGGSTGASLALVCAAKGYRLRIVTSTAFSEEKLTQMAAFGAELTLVPSEGGLITRTADPGHDRHRSRDEPGAAHVLDGSAEQHGQHRRLRADGRGDLVADRGTRRCVRAGGRHRRLASRRRARVATTRSQCGDHRGRAGRIRRALRRAARRAQNRGNRHRLHAPDVGPRASSTRSSPSRQRMRRRWPGGWRARKGCSRARHRAQTSSPQSEWASDSAPAQPSRHS